MFAALFLLSVAAASAWSTGVPGFDAAAGSSVDFGGSGRQTFELPSLALLPGESIRHRQVIENEGSKRVRYALLSASTNIDGKAVRDILHITIRSADPGATGTASSCDRFDGDILYAGALGASSARVGDSGMGAHDGDRELAAGASEALCIEVHLPLSADNAYQGATTTHDLRHPRRADRRQRLTRRPSAATCPHGDTNLSRISKVPTRTD